MRVTQRSMFLNFVNNMNSSLTDLMDLNQQSSSQKRVNKPSDDPIATSRILNYRDSLRNIDQYQENVDTAKGWLGVADSTMIQVNTVLTRCKELATQAATGSLDQDNRDQIAFEVRELFEQLITLGNTTFEGQHIFAGHKTDEPAFGLTLGLTTTDPSLDTSGYTLSGDTDHTIVVQFLSNAGNTNFEVGTDAFSYRYSYDGGRSWSIASAAAGSSTLDFAGVRLEMQPGSQVQAVDYSNPHSDDNGTWMWIRPAAEYMGDDEDSVYVDKFIADTGMTARTEGNFGKNVVVRIDENAGDATPGTVNLDEEIEYSYSLDGGLSWVSGLTVDSGTASNVTLVVPGGFLHLSNAGGGTLSPGEQFVIRPQTAKINFEISPNEYLAVNSVGKDVFGGVYQAPFSSNATPVEMGTASDAYARNMFEVVGRLVGYIESNDQDGIQNMLEDLETASTHIMTQAAKVGGKENRLEVAENVLTNIELDETERMSKIEDADVAELLTKLAQQELIYQSVLKSSSMIMQLNLTNFI